MKIVISVIGPKRFNKKVTQEQALEIKEAIIRIARTDRTINRLNYWTGILTPTKGLDRLALDGFKEAKIPTEIVFLSYEEDLKLIENEEDLYKKNPIYKRTFIFGQKKAPKGAIAERNKYIEKKLRNSDIPIVISVRDKKLPSQIQQTREKIAKEKGRLIICQI